MLAEEVRKQDGQSIPAGPQDAEGSAQVKPKARVDPDEPLPTPRVAFDKQIKCLLIYGIKSERGSKMVSLDEVAKVVDLNPSTVSLCNPFFVKVGLLIKSGKEFQPSAAVIDMARAHEFNPETASLKLAPIIQNSWFARSLEAKLRLGQTDVGQAIQILAEQANVGKDQENQLYMLLDYLREAGLIRRDGNSLSWISNREPPMREASQSPTGEPANEANHLSSGSSESKAAKGTGRLRLIETLVGYLPDESQPFTIEDLADWLRAAEANLRIVYRPKGSERIKIQIVKGQPDE